MYREAPGLMNRVDHPRGNKECQEVNGVVTCTDEAWTIEESPLNRSEERQELVWSSSGQHEQNTATRGIYDIL